MYLFKSKRFCLNNTNRSFYMKNFKFQENVRETEYYIKSENIKYKNIEIGYRNRIYNLVTE